MLLVAGLYDLIKVGSAEELKESVLDFEEVVRHQNRYHAHLGCNELYVAPLLIPPKLAWFPDNGKSLLSKACIVIFKVRQNLKRKVKLAPI